MTQKNQKSDPLMSIERQKMTNVVNEEVSHFEEIDYKELLDQLDAPLEDDASNVYGEHVSNDATPAVEVEIACDCRHMNDYTWLKLKSDNKLCVYHVFAVYSKQDILLLENVMNRDDKKLATCIRLWGNGRKSSARLNSMRFRESDKTFPQLKGQNVKLNFTENDIDMIKLSIAFEELNLYDNPTKCITITNKDASGEHRKIQAVDEIVMEKNVIRIRNQYVLGSSKLDKESIFAVPRHHLLSIFQAGFAYELNNGQFFSMPEMMCLRNENESHPGTPYCIHKDLIQMDHIVKVNGESVKKTNDYMNINTFIEGAISRHTNEGIIETLVQTRMTTHPGNRGQNFTHSDISFHELPWAYRSVENLDRLLTWIINNESNLGFYIEGGWNKFWNKDFRDAALEAYDHLKKSS